MKFQFCEIAKANGSKNINDWVEEWDNDYNLFKYQCFQPRQVADINDDEKKKLKKEFEEQVQDIKVEMINKVKEKVHTKIEEEEEIQMLQKVEKVKESSYKAIEKEIKLEKFLEEEEEAKEKEETDQIQHQIEHEKKKNDCLLKAIKEKSIEDQFNVSKSDVEEKIKEIQKETQQTVQIKRQLIKKKLAEMRRRQGNQLYFNL